MEVHGYTEKGSILATIDGTTLPVPDYAGNRHRRMIAEWEAQGNTIPAYSPPAVTVDMVRQEGARRLAALVADYTELERETWKGQLEEARVVLDGGSSDLLDTLAAPRSLTATEMATVIVGKADAFKTASGAILAAQEALLNMDPIPADYTDDTRWP